MIDDVVDDVDPDDDHHDDDDDGDDGDDAFGTFREQDAVISIIVKSQRSRPCIRSLPLGAALSIQLTARHSGRVDLDSNTCQAFHHIFSRVTILGRDGAFCSENITSMNSRMHYDVIWV